MRTRLAVILICVGFGLPAQTPVTFRYFYDDTGQLTKVVDSTGVVIEYVYDPVGNMREIRRAAQAPGALSIFSFTPQRAGPLTVVTIQGQGFSSTPGSNIVRFGSVPAKVVSATARTLVVEVPIGAVTGAITVMVGTTTVSSTSDFTVLPIPVITSLAPRATPPGSAIASFQVTGANLIGTTFSFEPSFTPPLITIGPVSVNPAGTVATMSVTVSGAASGDFVVIATNSFGSSDGFPSAANTLRVAYPMEVSSPLFSIRNSVRPVLPPGTANEANSPLFSIRNDVRPVPPPGTTNEANSPLFSILNGPAARSAILSRLRDRFRSAGESARGGGDGSVPDPALSGPDADTDGIPDSLELLLGTGPYTSDTDGDGFPDGLEVALGADPLSFQSVPNVQPSGDLMSVPIRIQNVSPPR